MILLSKFRLFILVNIMIVMLFGSCDKPPEFEESYSETSVPWLLSSLKLSQLKPHSDDIAIVDDLLSADLPKINRAKTVVLSKNEESRIRIIYLWQRRFRLEKCTTYIPKTEEAGITTPTIGNKIAATIDTSKFQDYFNFEIVPFYRETLNSKGNIVIPLFEDPVEDVRIFAMESVILLELYSYPVLDALIKSLVVPIYIYSDALPNPPFQSSILAAMPNNLTIDPMINVFIDPITEINIRLGVGEALKLLSLKTDMEIQPIIRLLKDDDPNIREISFDILNPVEGIGELLVKPFVEVLNDPSTTMELKRKVAKAMGKYGPEAVSSSDEISEMIDNAEYNYDLVPILSEITTPDARARELLYKYLEHKYSLVRSSAAQTLSKWPTNTKTVKILSNAYINEKDPYIRLAIIQSLSNFEFSDRLCFIMVTALSDGFSQIACFAAKVLGDFGHVANNALTALRKISQRDGASECKEVIETAIENLS